MDDRYVAPDGVTAAADGAYIVPASMLEDMYHYWTAPTVFTIPPRPPMPWHRRLRVRVTMARYALIRRLHDALFGSDYCDHDGCDW